MEARMRRTFTWMLVPALGSVVGALLVLPVQTYAQAVAEEQGTTPLPISVIKGKEFNLEKWADGVYLATGGAGSQDCIVVNDRDVLLFDTGTTPGGARALLEDLKLITDKPVRTVVNSHWHYDHVGGNAAFGPDVQIIGHENTRKAILTRDTLHIEPYLSWITRTNEQYELLTKEVAAEQDPEKKAALEKRLARATRDYERSKEIVHIPPTVTFDSRMTLYKGNREIQLLYLGKGHTAGDIVMYLPKERIVCSGDLIEGGISYLGDGYFDEWVTTLEALKKLDFAVDLPGHGAPFSDKEHITHLQNYLTDLIKQVSQLRAQGIGPEEAMKRIDLSSHEKDWPPRMRPIDIRGMHRVYEYLQERDAHE